VTVNVTGDYVLPAGQTISATNETALYFVNGTWSNIHLDGTLTVESSVHESAIEIGAASIATTGIVTIGESGSIQVHESGPGFAVAIGGLSAGSQLINLGRINVVSQGEAWGVGFTGGAFDNRGSVSVSALGNVVGVSMDAGGDFTNSGNVAVSGGSGPFQGSIGFLVYNSKALHQVINSGTIHVASLSSDVQSVGVLAAGYTNLVNAGLIEADRAIVFVPDGISHDAGRHLDVTNTVTGVLRGALFLDNFTGEPVSLSNAGTIVGDVTLNNGGDSFTNSGSVQGQVDLGSGNDTFDGVTGVLTGSLSGGLGNDVLRGGGGSGTLDGGGGSDLVIGGRGAQVVLGGDGDDTVSGVYNNTSVSGGAGNDTIQVDGYYTSDPLHLTRMDGGDGDDTFRVNVLSGRSLTIDGGSGHNTLEMHYQGDGLEPITLHLDGDASGGAWTGLGLQVVTVVGHTAAIVGGDANETITAPGTINGRGGDDVLTGSDPQAANPSLWLMALDGADTINGGLGNDTISGLSGTSYLRGDEGIDSITGGSAFDDINGNMGNDTLHGAAGDDWVVGGKDDDVQFGDAGSDVVWGNLGNDTLDGGDGNDQVRGGQGDDTLTGGAGDDFVSGDRGNDTESGGAGADLFHDSQDAGIDRVLDFHPSEGDRVMLDPGTTYSLSQVGADTVIDFGGGNQMILVGVQLSTLSPGWIFGN
jgi:hypothetical protein